MTDRNLKGLFFKMSGYMPQEVDEMIYRQKAVKEALKQQKKRKQQEKRESNYLKYTDRALILGDEKAERDTNKKKSKPERLKEQIQNGFDLAKRWSAE